MEEAVEYMDTEGSEDVSKGARLFDPAELLSMTSGGFAACLQVSWGKKLAIFDSGFVGIVPGHAGVGDQAAILLGCCLPLIVRSGRGGTYRLIGESYVHGVSEGELFDAGKTPRTELLALE